MLSFWIVKHFDVIEEVIMSILAGYVGFAPDALAFQQVKKAFSDRIVMALSVTIV